VPEYRTWDGNGSLVAFVVSLNLHRRHLTSSQRAVIALDVLPMLEEEARERMVAGVAANPAQLIAQGGGEAREQAAAMTGTNRQYVSDAKRIAQEAPDLLERVRTGETSITEAKRTIKERKREERRETNRQIIETVPTVQEAVELADVGGHEGRAQQVATIQTLLATCRAHGIDAYTYLVDVLQRINKHPASRVAELTPRLWAERFGQSPLRSDLATCQ
jgi:hypothetical protein